MALRHEDITYIQGLPAGSLEDKELAIAFKNGDKGAYQAIYDRYEARVHGVCRRMLGQKGDAEEAAQETFLRMYQGLPRFNGRYQLAAWITRIATNVCLDQLRSRSRKPVDPVPMEVFEADASPSDLSDPEELHLKNVDGWRVRRVLASLPPLHRAAIVLRDFEGLSYEEVAIALDITDCQVKALIHRARKGFKRSWSTNVASFLFPAKLLDRFRSIEVSARDQTAYLLNSGGQAAASCNIALQHCGQFMAQRAGEFAAVAVVTGVAVVAPAVARTTPQAPAPTATTIAHPRSADAVQETAVKAKTLAASKRTEASTEKDVRPEEEPTALAPAAGSEGEAPPSPQPVEEPAPEASPTEAAPDPLRASPAPEPTPAEEQSEPEPDGFSLGFSTDVGPQNPLCEACALASKVLSETGRASEDGLLQFAQSLQGTASHAGSPAYGLRLDHSSPDARDHRLNFSLSTAEGRYMYSGGGRLVATGSTSWGGWSYTYRGSYSLVGRPNHSERMPESGSYTFELHFSPSQARITSSSFSLTEGAS